MPTTKTQSCPECGGSMVHEKRADTVSYLGESATVRVPGWWCQSCEEAILDGDALRLREAAFVALKANVDGVLGPVEVAAVRERLGLSQRKAGELLGGGPRAFQKYESGKQAVSVPMSRLLTLLANDPGRLDELKGGSKASARGKRVPSTTGKRRAGPRSAAGQR